MTGGGHYLTLGPLTPRMLLGLAVLLLALPGMLGNLKEHLKNPLLLLFAVFLVYLLICAVRGIAAGNRQNVLLSDLKGFAWLFLVPVLVQTVREKARLAALLTVILAGAVTQAVLVLVINGVCTFTRSGIAVLYQPILDSRLGMLTRVSGRIFRIFLSSCPYLAVGCAIAVIRQGTHGKVRGQYVLCTALCLCAALLTFTRSVYGCIAVVAACVLGSFFFLFRGGMRAKWRQLAATAAATAALVFVLEFIFCAGYLNFAVSRTLGIPPAPSIAVQLRQALSKPEPAFAPRRTVPEQELERQEAYLEQTQQSDALRELTQRQLLDLIRRNPVFGNGLGAHAPCREDGLDEYFYLDMLARTGAVGLILYLLPFGYIVYLCRKQRKALARTPDAVSVLCGMAGFWAITWFNPWMNAVLGIAMYALTCTVPAVLKKTQLSIAER